MLILLVVSFGIFTATVCVPTSVIRVSYEQVFAVPACIFGR
jgi:hypothetical protein